jgi:hypothetical protein
LIPLQVNWALYGYMASSPTTARLARATIVTAGLAMTGAVIGGLCGASAMLAVAVIEEGLHVLPSREFLSILGLGAMAGAGAGIVGAPALAWGLLRRVPLGRAIVVTGLGTIGGAVVGELLNPINPYALTIPGVIAGGLAGFLTAGVALRLTARRDSSSSDAPAV